VDDAVAAVIGGALRRYLDANGELPPTHSLAAIVPEADRAPGQAADGKPPASPLLRWRHVRLGTDIADARQRLATLTAQAQDAPDEVAHLLGSPALAEVGEQASAALLAWSRRLVGRASARLGSSTPPANCTLAQLPAPAQPMYLCGARLSYFSAILPITDGLGLAFAVTRYDGRVVISPTSCRELMPDPEVFAQCLRDSFQDYLALTQPKPPPRPVRRRAPAKAPKPAVRTVRPAAAAAPTAARPGGSSAGRARRANRPG
jgi:diacylglycerol O-acyltransferase